MGETYIDELAWAVHEAYYRAEFPSLDVPHLLDWEWPLYRMYAVLAVAKGEDTTLEDVHTAWAAWVMEINPEHRCLVPFSELDRETQEKDRPYRDAIASVAYSKIRPTWMAG